MAQQNKNQPKAKTGLARWLQFVLLYLIYQFITSFGKSCLFTRICRS